MKTRFVLGLVASLTAATFFTVLIGLLAPAEAAGVQMSLKAGRTTLMEGSEVALTGAAPTARTGRVVRLQRKTGTSWTTVARRTLGPRHSYRFAIRPPRGMQQYRVYSPRQLGQAAAASRPLTLAVRWHPAITASSTAVLLPGNLWATRVSGTSLQGVGLWAEYRDPATGVWLGDFTGPPATVAAADGRYSFDFARYVPGTVVRLVTPPSGVRVKGATRPITILQGAIPLTLNQETVIQRLYPDANGVVPLTVTVEAGTLVSVTGRSEVLAPDGSPVAEEEPDERDITTFRAPVSGAYYLGWHPYPVTSSSVSVWATTPKVTPSDTPGCCPFQQDLPGQVVDVTIDLDAGDMVALNQSTYENAASQIGLRVLLDPHGVPVPPPLTTWEGEGDRTKFYRIAETGTYTVRSFPKSSTSDMINDAHLNELPTTDLVMGAERVWVIGGRARFSATAGQKVLLRQSEFSTLYSPAGQATNTFGPIQCLQTSETGTFDVLMASMNFMSVELVDECP